MNTILTDGVSVRGEAGKPVIVSIELVEGEPGSDAAALLAQAWAQLGQAISANKQPGASEQYQRCHRRACPRGGRVVVRIGRARQARLACT
jgi:hypothetical protein